MTPYESYVMYLALKRHFTSESYDFIRYNGKVPVSTSAFDARKDKYQFQKLSKKADVRNYLLANFVEDGPDIWVGDLVSNGRSDYIYNVWLGRQQSLTRIFKNDLEKLKPDFDTNFTPTATSSHPYLLKLLLSKSISIETVIILNELVAFFPAWCRILKDDPVWKTVHMRCMKYKPFLNYDKQKFKELAIKTITENKD